MGVIVFISSLSPSVSSSDLQALAEKYGTVKRAWIATRPAGGSLGFGYVEMSTAADAKALTIAVNTGLPTLRSSLVIPPLDPPLDTQKTPSLEIPLSSPLL